MLQAEAEPTEEEDFRIFESEDTESTKEQSLKAIILSVQNLSVTI